MKRIVGWTSVRSRLLLSFSVLFLSSVVLAGVGWLGLRNTGKAVENFRSHVLPEVSLSLELSQRAAAIAAIAPYVAESTLPFQLQAEAQAMRARMADVERLGASLPASSRLARDVTPVLAEVRANVDELIDVTRRDLFLQEDVREFHYALDSLRATLPAGPAGKTLRRILLDIESVAQTADAPSLERLRSSISAEVEQAYRDAPAPDAAIEFIGAHLSGADDIFAVRQRHFRLAERKAFLVIQARAQADRLGERVEAYVRDLRASVDAEASAVDRALQSGIVGILLIGLACVAAAVLGIGFVNRTVNSLGRTTRVMTLLASGDVDQSTPEIARRDELGDLARAFEVFRENAREIRRISQDLREQTSLLETVIESLKDGLSVFDRRGRLLTWNRQYAALLELPEDVLERGMNLERIQALLPSQVSDGVGATSTLNQLNLPRQHEERRFELVFPGGRVVEFRSNPMPGGGFVTLYSDLTERRNVELQLRQAQKMEVLGQLTSGVAHDFNNLLAAIIGNVYLLEISKQISPEDRRLAMRVSKAAERGATLTGRLLAFARRQNLSPQSVQIDTLIADLVDLIEYSIGSNVQLETDLAADEERVWVDKGQLENAVLNLVINARDAMPEGGRLRLATSVDRRRSVICVQVADTGRGMDARTRERMFEPFFTTKGLGSGLGLSIVYGFVNQSGGDIAVDSRPGGGTRIVLSLPIAPTQAAQEPASLLPEDIVPAQTVLLVEDDADVQSAVADVLRSMGHTVTIAHDAAEALGLLSDAVSVVLSDVDLGGEVNGAQLALEVASRRPQVPCILMSGLPYEVLSSRFQLREPALLLAKPFSARQLEASLRRAFRHALA
jgi:signal transduction histidine kinase/CheY-like chemotaxis protein/HAMP domain-containing protein